MVPRNQPQEQPQQLFQDAAQDVQAQKAQAELEATVLRFWDTVRKSADVIVTLRQENAVLQAQVAALRKSEAEAQAGRGLSEAPLADPSPLAAPIAASVAIPEISATDEAIEALIAKARETEMRAHEAEVRGLRTNIDRLEDELNRLQNELNEAQAQLIDHSTISEQLAHVRVELESRSKLLLELQVTLEEQRNARQLDQRQLDQQLDQRQLDIFGTMPQLNAFATAPQRGMAPAEMLALASRLDVLSGRITSLFGIA